MMNQLAKKELYHVPDLNDITCRGDENECSVKRFSTKEEPADDFNILSKIWTELFLTLIHPE
jgi:hypothetical protein